MDVSIIVNLLSAAGVIISVFYLSRQVAIATQTHQENHEWNRRIETKCPFGNRA